jgi:hypothetical protein
MRFSRLQILLPVLALLFSANLLYWWISGWGLITLNANPKPLKDVIRIFERQGGVTIKTNLDPETPVTLSLHRAPLLEALDILATRVEARCRLAYILGPNRNDLNAYLNAWSANQPPADWSELYRPMPPLLIPGTEDITFDPRVDQVNITNSAAKDFQSIVKLASPQIDAALLYPTSWNPPVNARPANAQVGKFFSKLSSQAGGQSEELFLLSKRDRPNGPPGEGGPRRFGGGEPMDPGAMESRLADRIARLPVDQQAEAQTWLNDQKKLWTEIQALPPEQRMEKIREEMQKPEVQDRMEEQRSKRDSQRTPQQRRDRMKNYVDRRAAAKAK